MWSHGEKAVESQGVEGIEGYEWMMSAPLEKGPGGEMGLATGGGGGGGKLDS